MIKSVLVLILSLLWHTSSAQIPEEEKVHLQNLLTERAKNFSEYTNSIQKRSGIFGNKTKADIAKSNEILIDIVTLDNNIMDALNRALRYKTFEKATENYSSRDCEVRLQQSMQVTDTLMKQIETLEGQVRKRNSGATTYKVLFYLLLAGCVGGGIWLRRRSKKLQVK